MASEVAEIPKRRLKAVESHFRSIAEGSSKLRNRDIDWRVVKKQLLRFEAALKQGDIREFEEAFAMLKTRLSLANVLRGQIGAESKVESHKMPPPVLELLNHIVDTLHFENTQSSAKDQKNESKQQGSYGVKN